MMRSTDAEMYSDSAEEYWAAYDRACADESNPVLMLYNPVTKRFYPADFVRNEDRGAEKAVRLTHQIEYEGIGAYKLIHEAGWGMYTDGLRKRGLAYCGVPRPNDVYATLSQDGDRELPPASSTKIEVFARWFEEQPSGKLIRSSRGFGGEEWRGTRPPPKGNIKIFRSARTISKTLTEDEIEHRLIGDEVTLADGIENADAEKYVRERFS